MADTLTTTYDFTRPEVGGSDNSWGDKLNANWEKLDGFLSSVTTETGFIGGSTSTIGTGIRVAGTSPIVQWNETDEVLPNGRIRAIMQTGALVFQDNTAAGGDFSTNQGILSLRNTGVTFTTPILSAINLVNAAPIVNFEETDQTDPIGRFRFYGLAGSFYLQKAVTANWATYRDLMWYSLASAYMNIQDLNVPGNFTAANATFDTVATFTGPATFSASANIVTAAPLFTMQESDQTAPAGQYRHFVFNDTYLFQRAATANFATTKSIWRYSTGGSGNFYVDVPLIVASGGVTTTGPVEGSLVHRQDGGVVKIGAEATATHGTGNGNLSWDQTVKRLRLTAESGGLATFQATAMLVPSGFYSDSTDFNTTPKTRLATDNGTVEIGGATMAALKFMRPGVNYCGQVPDGQIFRIQNHSATIWASVSSASGWAAGSSDIRLKENVAPIHYGLDTVMALKPIQFDWISERRHDIGFSAQDVEKIIPEIVEIWEADPAMEGQIDTYAMRKDALVAVLVKAVQELVARLEILEGARHA